MDDDKTQKAISRGARAKALLDNDLLSESFDKLEGNYLDAWKATSPLQTDVREKVWVAFQLVGKMREQLRTVVDGGKIAQAELNRAISLEKSKTR